MSWSGAAAVLAFAAGLGGATQIAVQSRLGDRVGALEAVATASVVGGGVAVAGAKWQLLGGVMSVFIVLTITVAGPRIGVVATTAFLIAAQLSFATLIDRYGWFGVQTGPGSWGGRGGG